MYNPLHTYTEKNEQNDICLVNTITNVAGYPSATTDGSTFCCCVTAKSCI